MKLPQVFPHLQQHSTPTHHQCRPRSLSTDVQLEPLEIMYLGETENPIELDEEIDISTLPSRQGTTSPHRSSTRLYHKKVLSKKPRSSSTVLDDVVEKEQSNFDDSSDEDFKATDDNKASSESEEVSLEAESPKEKKVQSDTHTFLNSDDELLAKFIAERKATLKRKRTEKQSIETEVEEGHKSTPCTDTEAQMDELFDDLFTYPVEPMLAESNHDVPAPVPTEDSPIPEETVPAHENIQIEEEVEPNVEEDDLFSDGSDYGLVFGQIAKEAEKVHKGCLSYPSLIYLILRHQGFTPSRSDHAGPAPELFTVNKNLLFGDRVVDLLWGSTSHMPDVAHSVGNISGHTLDSVFTSSFLRSQVHKLNAQIKELTNLRDIFQNILSSQKGGEDDNQGDQGADGDDEEEEDAEGVASLAAAAGLADLRTSVASTSGSRFEDEED